MGEGDDAGTLPVGEVVPCRSVLTELARGFLLTREGDRGRARRFATTFLRERATVDPPSAPYRVSIDPTSVTVGRRLLGRLPHGAVERPSRLRLL